MKCLYKLCLMILEKYPYANPFNFFFSMMIWLSLDCRLPSLGSPLKRTGKNALRYLYRYKLKIDMWVIK